MQNCHLKTQALIAPSQILKTKQNVVCQTDATSIVLGTENGRVELWERVGNGSAPGTEIRGKSGLYRRLGPLQGHSDLVKGLYFVGSSMLGLLLWCIFITMALILGNGMVLLGGKSALHTPRWRNSF